MGKKGIIHFLYTIFLCSICIEQCKHILMARIEFHRKYSKEMECFFLCGILHNYLYIPHEQIACAVAILLHQMKLPNKIGVYLHTSSNSALCSLNYI